MKEAYERPELHRAREGYKRFFEGELQPLERAFERLEGQTHWAADKEREALRPRLAEAYPRRDAWLRRIAIEEEIESRVNILWPLHTQKLGSLERRFERMAASPDVPDSADFLDFCQDNLEVERLRLVLFEATQLDEFRRPFDAVRALKAHWFDVNRDREKRFHLIGPGNKPRLGEPAWLAQARRLTELRASTTAQKENGYAIR